VDKLLKQIGGFMSDIADDFKMVVVDAIRSLCLKFPAKHRSLMAFLSSVLREEGGFEYKKSIVGAILGLIQVRGARGVACRVCCVCVWGVHGTRACSRPCLAAASMLHKLGHDEPGTFVRTTR
jgi:hypothetical protein